MRAGREPAEDVKRRLAAACQEVGLTVAYATMHLMPEAGARLIHVGASVPGWPYEAATIALMVKVSTTGQWPDFVDIRCCASEGDPAQGDGPWLRGRDQVPFTELVEQLQATLAERAQVVTAVKLGHLGPYKFAFSLGTG